MVTHFDHVTIVVRDVSKAKGFFALLGFIEQQSVVISGAQFARYMGIPAIEAEHITLALANATPRVEVQLLRYRHPEPIPDREIARLNKLGFNHVCFKVEDIDAEVRRLQRKRQTRLHHDSRCRRRGVETFTCLHPRDLLF